MAETNVLYAAVMIKGTVKITRKVVDTLKKLKLGSVNTCIVIPGDSTYRGMLKNVAEFATWGEIDQETLEQLLQKRGKIDAKAAKAAATKALKDGKLEERKVFRLSPPTGGFKTVRLNYPMGDTGYRGPEINALLKRMI
ncbi:MAG: uL30 family ribosomal protein [Candidatus Aenigmarchaeota archaeon]|nr:uL30 family ribosomal protein [Candidatus Aenigmarchaeota archaeon]